MMKIINCCVLIFVCLYCFISKTFCQSDAAKMVINTYYNYFGKAPNTSELNRDVRLVNMQDTASVQNLRNEYVKFIKDSAALQKEIIRTAFQNTYGSASPTETDSCFRTIKNGDVTYQSVIDEIKNNLTVNIAGELKIIQRSYYDYFGIQIDKDDKRIKAWLDSSVANAGLLYKTLMDEHRLYVIAAPDEQKAIISRAFTAVFGRAIKIAEADSWFNTCKYGCSFTDLEKKFEEYKKHDPKAEPPVLAPAGTGDIVYIRVGVVLNEACNCTGQKMFLVNADAGTSYKVTIATYSLQTNNTIISQFIIPPHQEKLLGCTKDLDCIHSLAYSVLSYEKI